MILSEKFIKENGWKVNQETEDLCNSVLSYFVGLDKNGNKIDSGLWAPMKFSKEEQDAFDEGQLKLLKEISLKNALECLHEDFQESIAKGIMWVIHEDENSKNEYLKSVSIKEDEIQFYIPITDIKARNWQTGERMSI